MLVASDCINIRGNWISAHRQRWVGQEYWEGMNVRIGGVWKKGFFLSPSTTVFPLEMLMKSDKLQNYIPGKCFFFTHSLSLFLRVSDKLAKVLTSQGRGSIYVHVRVYTKRARRGTTVFPFSNRFIFFLFTSSPPHTETKGRRDVLSSEGNTPPTPPPPWSLVSFAPIFRCYRLKFLRRRSLVLFNNESLPIGLVGSPVEFIIVIFIRRTSRFFLVQYYQPSYVPGVTESWRDSLRSRHIWFPTGSSRKLLAWKTNLRFLLIRQNDTQGFDKLYSNRRFTIRIKITSNITIYSKI